MFYLHIVLCNMKRNKWKSISTVSICIFIFILLNLYLTYIYNCKMQLNDLPNISPIYCSISNLNGSSQVGLEISLHYAPLELLSLEIIGTMELFSTNTLQLPPDILIPFGTVREVFHQNKIDFYADSASFYVTDPLQLNVFKDEMKSFGLLERAPSAKLTYDGIALAVRDTTFRTLASQLRQSIDSLEGFFPLR